MQLRALPRAFYQAARLHPPELSAEAQGRLRWLRAWEALRSQGLTSREASGVLTLPRASLYRWRRRLAGEGPRGLEGRSRRPKRCRRPSWSPELAQAVSRLREKHLAEGRPINLKSLMEDIDVPIAAWRFDEGVLTESTWRQNCTWCPYQEAWRGIGHQEHAYLWDYEFHLALFRTYHPGVQVQFEKIQTRGDPTCNFRFSIPELQGAELTGQA